MSQVSLFIFGSIIFFIAVYGAFVYLVQQAKEWGQRDSYENSQSSFYYADSKGTISKSTHNEPLKHY